MIPRLGAFLLVCLLISAITVLSVLLVVSVLIDGLLDTLALMSGLL